MRPKLEVRKWRIPAIQPGAYRQVAVRALTAKRTCSIFVLVTTETAQLDVMRQAAFGLGMGFARAAEVEGDLDRKLRLFDAFHRSFASVRLSIALAMRLGREARLSAEPERAEREVERAEALERPDHPERPERYDERDRERDRETASLPILLRTLERVADDAQTLLPRAAELPTLRELLDRVRAEPAPPTPSPPTSTRAASPLRARLSGGTATLTLTPASRPGLPGLPGVPPRRSTGPPRR